MSKVLPEISKQISAEGIRVVLYKNYSSIVGVWAPMQIAWLNGVYKTFNDHEKFMIVMHLMKKTFEAYSRNFVKLNYEEFFDQTMIEIDKSNVMEISKSLKMPKETARRKVIELEKMGTIKKIGKKIIIDRKTWPNIKPEDTIRRVTKFLSTLSKMVCNERLISKPITSESLTETCKEYFSYVWKLYYEMQIPFLLDFKKIYGDLESFHINGIVITNHILNVKKNDNSEMSRDFYLEKYFLTDQKNFTGINAMSISDITNIPRATVVRKLNKLVKNKFLHKNKKKLYSPMGLQVKKILEVQKNTLNNLSKLAMNVYNLNLMKVY